MSREDHIRRTQDEASSVAMPVLAVAAPAPAPVEENVTDFDDVKPVEAPTPKKRSHHKAKKDNTA